ncbi:MAG: hypothetical protein CMO81_04370 [Waddliaceae bacterium]|nr:hypothetical protein [Waddliaceae bacterium]
MSITSSQSLADIASQMSQNKAVYIVKDGKLCKASGPLYRFERKVHPIKSYQVEQLALHVLTLVKQNEIGSSDLAHTLLSRYKNVKGRANNALAKLDRALVAQAAQDGRGAEFEMLVNQQFLKRWTRYGHSEEMIKKYPEDFNRLYQDSVLGQMKVFCGELKEAHEKNHELSLLVNGKWTTTSNFYKIFERVDGKGIHQDDRQIRSKETGKVYSYLGNGLGFEAFSSACDPLKVICRIPSSEVDELVTLGNAFWEEENLEAPKNPQFVVQIVSSFVNLCNDKKSLKNAFHKGRMSQLLFQPKHPYQRIICTEDDLVLGDMQLKKGDVLEVGFGWEKAPKLPFKTTKGRYRGIDFWEYKTPDKRFISNITIEKEQAQNFFNSTRSRLTAQLESGEYIPFNLARYNCTAYLVEVLKNSHIVDIEKDIKIQLPDLVKKISPKHLEGSTRNGYKVARFLHKNTGRAAKKILPSPFYKALLKADKTSFNVFEKTASLGTAAGISTVGAVLGNQLGDSGRTASGEGSVGPSMRDIFNLDAYYYYLPGLVQVWQRKHPKSTRVFDHQTAIAICKSGREMKDSEKLTSDLDS